MPLSTTAPLTPDSAGKVRVSIGQTTPAWTVVLDDEVGGWLDDEDDGDAVGVDVELLVAGEPPPPGCVAQAATAAPSSATTTTDSCVVRSERILTTLLSGSIAQRPEAFALTVSLPARAE